MKYRTGGWIAALAAVLLAAAPAFAAVAQEPAYKLGEVVVSAPGTGAEAVSTVHTVTAKQIRDRGARDLAQALELVPGVIVRTAADGTPRIDIRGFRTRHVLLLLDGIPINSTLDGQFDPASISVENIAEIKVTTGGASVLYGQGGNGGVINIISKKGGPGVHGMIGGEGGEADQYLGKFSLSGATDKVNAFISGSVYNRHAYHLSDNFTPTPAQASGPRDNSARERENLFLNLGYTPTARTQMGFTMTYIGGHYGIPSVVNFDKNNPFTKKPKYERIDGIQGVMAQLALQHDFQGPLSLRSWAFFNNQEEVDNRYDDATYSTQTQKGSLHSDNTTQIAGANLQLRYDMQKAGAATLALKGENDRWMGHGFNVDQANKKSPVVAVPFQENKNLQIYTAALQYTVNPLPALGVVLGYGENFQQRPGDNQQDFSYQIGLHYDLFPGTRLKISHERRVRFPSIQQLYDIASGNPTLKTERSLHYEAGIEQVLPADTWASFSLYRIDAHNFIEKDNTTDLYSNFQRYRFQGFEVTVENHYVKHLALRASYTYLDAKNLSAGRALNDLQYRPRDTVTLEGRYAFAWGMTADASMLYIGHQYYLDKTSTLAHPLDTYTLVNLKISQDLLHKRLSIYAGANNLLDQNYAQSYGFPLAGRTLYGGFEYRF